jgi:hypothetical protein
MEKVTLVRQKVQQNGDPDGPPEAWQPEITEHGMKPAEQPGVPTEKRPRVRAPKRSFNIAQDSGTGSRQMCQRLASDTLDWSKLSLRQMAQKPVDFIMSRSQKVCSSFDN